MSAARLVSVSCRCPNNVSPEAFLASARGRERFYWRDNEVTLVGIGITAEITAWGERRFEIVREKATALFDGVQVLDGGAVMAQPRLFGGFSFQSDFITERTWAQFAPAYFILPHFQLVSHDGEQWLTLNIQLGEDEIADETALQAALVEQCTALQGLSYSRQPSAHPTQVDYPMSFEQWTTMIHSAVHQMQTGILKKVVLARVCELRFEERVDVDRALDFLNEAYADSYRFLFEPVPYLAFFGATPELLVAVQGQELRTMALAGSIKRGATTTDDEALTARLLADPKERYEHQLVVDGIRERLTPLTTALAIPAQPGTLQLRNIQHLFTPVQGRLKAANGVLPLLETLHPTPALGGMPQAGALDFIRHAEPVPRGWYAAPIGWIDSQLDGTFAVAIRSAVSQNERVWLYAGAGIVAESQPLREWEETALKFKPMLDALGAQPKLIAEVAAHVRT